MADLTLKSESQILADLISSFIAETGINDTNRIAIIRQLFEAVAQEDFAQYYQMVRIIANYVLDSTTGTDLDNRGFDFGLTRFAAAKATEKVDIQRAASFTKVSTTIYVAKPAPYIGGTKLYVNDASDALYSTSGTLIIGRNTTNEEEVTYAAGPIDYTNYWEFTVSAFTKDHDFSETVILKQGNDESILRGTVVQTQPGADGSVIQFVIDNDVTLLSGEAELTDVDITAVEAGSDANIGIGDIIGTSAFPSPPFTDARAENTTRFTTGRDRETDDEFRDRIKNFIPSNSKGVKSAILNSIVGLVDPDSAKRVVSANVISPTVSGDLVKVIIDDGTGFEPSFSDQGFESVIESATGGEKRLQTNNFPLAKAQVESNSSEPFDMSSGALTLTIATNLQTETITFNPSDFRFSDSVSAEEIVNAINDKAVLFQAFTSNNQKNIIILSRSNTNEDIQVTGGTSNTILNFPTDLKSTLFLYKNDTLLSKDGSTAFIDSQNSATYNLAAIGAFPHTLTIVVDGKTANVQTVTFQAADFADTSQCTVAEVNVVINAQLSGAVASAIESNSKIRLVSNTELSSGSKINVTGGTANNAVNGFNFSTVEVVGTDKDYELNKELGIIELVNNLVANDKITIGSNFTRAKLRAASAENYSVTAGQTLVISIDGGGNQTITFPSTTSLTAAQAATEINSQLNGGLAFSTSIGGSNYLEIQTNTFEQANGSIRIDSSSTATAFGFTTDTTIDNIRPHTAFKVTTNAGPFGFVEDDNLIIIIDDTPSTKSYNIVVSYEDAVTSGSSTTVFVSSTIKNIFDTALELIDYYCIMLSGNNTTSGSGTVTTITDQGGDTWRYTLSANPTNFANFATGDMVTFSNMQNSENDGNFLVTGISVASKYVEVTNADGIAESGSTGDIFLGQRRQISNYSSVTGTITVSSGYTNTPVAAETFVVLPSTIDNLVAYLENTKITALSNSAEITGGENNTKLQIASLSSGSSGYVQVSGGNANDLLGFDTSLLRGLYGYNYYIGLIKIVHSTIYGDDTDLVTYPGVGAAGIDFEILPPTIQEVTVSLQVTLVKDVSISQVENEIKSAITGYINNLDIGEDVILEKIRTQVMQVRNVTDVVAVSPTQNVPIADNEKAKTTNSLISLGE